MSNNLDNIFRQVAQQHEEEFVQQDWELMQQKLQHSGIAASDANAPTPANKPESQAGFGWGKWAVGFAQGFVFMGLISYVVSSVRLQDEQFVIASGHYDPKSIDIANNGVSGNNRPKNKAKATPKIKETKAVNWDTAKALIQNESSVQHTEITSSQSKNSADDITFTKENTINPALNKESREINGEVADLNVLEGKTSLPVAETPFFAPVEKPPVRIKRRQFIQTDKKSTAITININPTQQQQEQDAPASEKVNVLASKDSIQPIDKVVVEAEYVRSVGTLTDSTPKTCAQECKAMLSDAAVKNDSTNKDDKKYSERLLHIGFAPVLSSNGANANEYVNNISVHGAISQSAGLEGFEVAGIGNITQDYTKGVQIGGVFNVVKKNMKGLQVAGVANCSGIVKGVQIAGAVNTSCNVNGVQASGVINAAGNLEGAQMAGVVNVAHEVTGVQAASVLNVAHDLKGVQVASLVNVAKKVNGWQVGLFNFADTVESGGAIGLLGYSRRSHKYIHAWTNPTINTNVGLRFTHGRIYNIASIGYNISDAGSHKRHALGYGMGIKATEYGRVSIMADMMYFRIGEKGFFSRNVGGMLQGRANVAWHLSHHASLFAGPAVYLFHSRTESGAELGSLTLFANKIGNNYQRAWVALNIGLEF